MSLTNLEKTVVEYQQAGTAWIEAKLKSDQAEEGQKSFLAAIVDELDDNNTAEGKLERMAKATPRYRKYVAAMCAARAETLRRRVRFDSLGMLFEARRSELSYQKEQVAKGIFHTGGR